MSDNNGAKWQVVILILSGVIFTWLSGLTAGVINNYYRAEDKITNASNDNNVKYSLIIERLARLETKIDRIDK